MPSNLKVLKDSLTVLAPQADVQLMHLEQLGIPGCIDELALEYDDVAHTVDIMLERNDLEERQLYCVKKLDALLERMSGPNTTHLWTAEAFRSAREWNQVRALATECLAFIR